MGGVHRSIMCQSYCSTDKVLDLCNFTEWVCVCFFHLFVASFMTNKNNCSNNWFLVYSLWSKQCFCWSPHHQYYLALIQLLNLKYYTTEVSLIFCQDFHSFNCFSRLCTDFYLHKPYGVKKSGIPKDYSMVYHSSPLMYTTANFHCESQLITSLT